MSLTRTSKRLVSLDVLRGITVCGMILVNNAGACGYAYAPLKHAKWDGFTPADLVFPAFMFIMGVSIYLSLNKSNFDWRISIARILRRTVLIFMSGVALKWILAFIATGEYNTLENLRIMGVLQPFCLSGIICCNFSGTDLRNVPGILSLWSIMPCWENLICIWAELNSSTPKGY